MIVEEKKTKEKKINNKSFLKNNLKKKKHIPQSIKLATQSQTSSCIRGYDWVPCAQKH